MDFPGPDEPAGMSALSSPIPPRHQPLPMEMYAEPDPSDVSSERTSLLSEESCELRSGDRGETCVTRCAQGDFFMHASEVPLRVEVMSVTLVWLPAWLQSVLLFEQKTWYVAEVLCLLL
jgi:hypothetical protein